MGAWANRWVDDRQVHRGFGIWVHVVMVGVNSPYCLLRHLCLCWISDSQCHLSCPGAHVYIGAGVLGEKAQQNHGKYLSNMVATDFLIKIWASIFLSVWSWASYITFVSVSSASRLNQYTPGRQNNVTTQRILLVVDSKYFLWNTHSKVFRETNVSKLPEAISFLCTVGILNPNRE